MLLCGECGNINIQKQNVIGKSFPYKQYEKVKLEVDLFLNVCRNCDNIILKNGDCVSLDDAIEKSLKTRGTL